MFPMRIYIRPVFLKSWFVYLIYLIVLQYAAVKPCASVVLVTAKFTAQHPLPDVFKMADCSTCAPGRSIVVCPLHDSFYLGLRIVLILILLYTDRNEHWMSQLEHKLSVCLSIHQWLKCWALTCLSLTAWVSFSLSLSLSHTLPSIQISHNCNGTIICRRKSVERQEWTLDSGLHFRKFQIMHGMQCQLNESNH